jgi:uncharacterized membrane protein
MAEAGEKKIREFFKNNWQEIVLGSGVALYSIYFTVASFLRYVNFYTGRFDLGNMDQTVWNTLHGNFFAITDPNGVNQVSRLAFHADFILAFLSPFYVIWEDPRTLLLIQSVILALGGVFVYLIAKQILQNKTISLILGVCYLLNPAVQYTNLFDFHGVTLATTFLLAAFYFTITKRWWAVVLFLFLAGITKEQVWAVSALFGFYIFFISKKRALGTFIITASVFTFYYLIWIAIPKAAGGEHFAIGFYSDYGANPGQIVKNMLIHPVSGIHTLFMPDRIDYIKKLFIPLGYFSFLAFPILIFAAPDLVIDLLSNFSPMHQIYYQYSTTITPFIFIAAIYGIKIITKKFPQIPLSAVSIMLLIFTLCSAYNYGPLPLAKKPNDAWYKKPLTNRAVVDKYLNSIPDSAVVSASNTLASHLSERRQIFVVPLGIDKSDYILILDETPTKEEKGIFDDVKKNHEFRLEYHDTNFYVFKRITS